MTRSMLDAAGLHDPILNADVWAGYLRSPHASGGGWPLSYWPRAKAHAHELFPIFVVGPPYNADAIVASIHVQMMSLGAPTGVAVGIDIEHYDAQSAHTSGVWPSLQIRLPEVGFIPVVYCSGTDAGLFPGRQFIGDWTRHEHRFGSSAITQWAASPGWGAPDGYDLSTVYDDSLSLWPVHAPVGPGPAPGGKMWLPPVPAADGVGVYAINDKGAVYAYGAAKYHGGEATLEHDHPGARMATPVAGLAPTPDDGGYWILDASGHFFTFGNAPYLGAPADPAHA